MTATAHKLNGSTAVNRGLRRYAEALGHRRSLRRVLGPDVDPDYCLTDFLHAIGTKNQQRLTKVYESSRTKAALGHPSGPSGGYLVPADLQLELMQDVAEEGIFRPQATVVPMDCYTLRLPLPDASTAPAGASIAPFFGGIQMKWTLEGATRPETEPTFRAVDLTAWDLTGYALQSNTFMADGGPGLETFFRTLFARSIAWYEDYAYFQGNGVGQPMGLLNGGGTVFVDRETSGHITSEDIGEMSGTLLPASWPRAIWAVSPTAWLDLLNLGGGASGVSPAWQINQPFLDGPGHFILNGRPGFVSEKLPAAGTKGDIFLFDPMLYVIGDRQAVEVDVSFDEPTAFTKNQAVWRVIYRGDGQPWFGKSITLQDASTVVSPYVGIVT